MKKMYVIMFLALFSTAKLCIAGQIIFRAHLPDSTPLSDTVYIAGNFNEWNAAGTAMKRTGDIAAAEIDLGKLNKVEYKYTRGSWATVEKAADGTEINNRKIDSSKSRIVYDTIQNWADKVKGAKPMEHSLTGNIKYVNDFYSPQLKNKRTLIIYLPPEYDKDTAVRYPVLYMHDGQNIFDKATSFAGNEWRADETAEQLIKSKRIVPLIIVGIYNNDKRMDEYTPWPDEKYKGGSGAAYADFVVNTVKPYIDSHFRTLPGAENTAMIGSSLGGLISLYIGFKYPQVFSKIGAMSTSVWWAKSEIINYVLNQRRGPSKIYMDIGTNETSESQESSGIYLAEARKLKNTLITKGYIPGEKFQYFEDAGALHSEVFWAKRFARPLLFFFGGK